MGFGRLNRAPVRSVPTPVRVLFACEALLGALYVVDWALGHPSDQISHIVNLDGEANLPTWFSSMQLFGLGILLASSARWTTRWRDRSTWPALAAALLCVAMSCEEVTQVHEWFAGRGERLLLGESRKVVRAILPNTGVWMFFFAPPFILASAILWRRFRRTLEGQPAVARKYLLGFSIYVFSVFGLEFAANFVTRGAASDIIATAGEELGEMAGVTILIWATLDRLAARRPHITYRPKVHPPDYLARVS